MYGSRELEEELASILLNEIKYRAMKKTIAKQEKIINSMAKDMFCYLDNIISTYKKVNSVEELIIIMYYI